MTDPIFYSLCLVAIIAFILLVMLWRKKNKAKATLIDFKDGKYTTSDPKTIEWMRGHPCYDKDYFEDKA